MMLKRRLIFVFLVVSLQVFPQWKSFYPEKKEKTNEKEIIEKDNFSFNTNFFEALKAKSLEEYEQALKLFQKCIKLNKNIPTPYYESALINQNIGNYDLAIEQIKKAISLDLENKWYMIAYAEILFFNEDFQNAANQYKKLIKIEPGNEQWYFMLSDTYIYNRDFQKAINVYDQLEKHKGVDKTLSIQKQKLYMELNKTNKAIIEIIELLKKFPEDIESMEILSDLYLLNDEKEKAFDMFKKIVILSPENGRIRLTLADYYREQGDNTKSYEELKLAFKSKKLGVDIKIGVLASYYQLISDNSKMSNQAYELAEILIKTHPNDIKTNAVYADILYISNRFQEAKEQYFIVLEKDKTKPEVWTQILFIQAEQNDFSEMINTSEEALIYFPTNPLFYYFNGISNKRFKNYELAIYSLETGIEFVINNDKLLMEFYSSLAEAYHAIKKHDFSDSLYEKALLIDSLNVIVLNNYAYYLSLRKHNLNKAKEMSLKSNNINPNNGTYQDTYAWILYKMEKFKEAEEWILKALNNGSEKSPVVVEHYGDILYMLGDFNAAIIQWKKAKSLGGESKMLNKKIEEKTLYE